MIITREEGLSYLALARELKDDSPWIDIHVHPFEIIFNSFRYMSNPFKKEIFSLDNSVYKPPSISPLRLVNEPYKPEVSLPQQDVSQMSILLYRQYYAHTGPRVLEDQMKLSGIDLSLLLPVLQPESDGQKEMELMIRIFGGNKGFLFAYCVPNTIDNNDIKNDVRSAARLYNIRAIKLHPNITGIDLSKPGGRERVEAILEACQESNLPLIIHGGISPVIKNPAAQNYASLLNLTHINWGITTRPVIISHAGMIGASQTEIESELLPELKKILSSYDHVMIDISAIELTTLILIIKNIEKERIVFGSDSFYFSQWGSIVKLLCALKMTANRFEDFFLQIVARNPARFLGGVGEVK